MRRTKWNMLVWQVESIKSTNRDLGFNGKYFANNDLYEQQGGRKSDFMVFRILLRIRKIKNTYHNQGCKFFPERNKKVKILSQNAELRRKILLLFKKN